MVDIVYPTVNGIVTKVQNLIGEVSGSSVQKYSEEFTRNFVIDAFDFIFLKQKWLHYQRWDTITVDGVNGKATAANPFGDVSGVLENFIGVYRNGQVTPVPQLPASMANPNVLTGTTVQYWSALPVTDADFIKKRLKFWPLTSTTVCNVNVRLHPGVLVGASILYMDELLIKYGAAWMMLEDEGTNPAGAAKYEKLFDQRYQDLIKQTADQPIRYTGPTAPLNQWVEH